MGKAAVIETSTARTNFAKLGNQARLAPVEVTRHGRLEFVVISPELYETVKAAGAVPAGELERQQDAFDRMVREMQSDRSNAAYDRLEALTAGDLPKAVADARRQAEVSARPRRPGSH